MSLLRLLTLSMVMKIVRKLWPYLGLILLALMLAGCSVINEFYLSNHTDEALNVRVTFQREVDSLMTFDSLLVAGSALETANSNQFESFSETLTYQSDDADTIEFSLPAQTTTYLGAVTNDPDLFTELEITSGQLNLTITEQNQEQYFETKDQFFGNIVHVFNVTADTTEAAAIPQSGNMPL